jgi:glycolate oxidase subunit GlcD
VDQLIKNLRALVGRANVLAERDELIVYECDGLTQHRHAPRAVVFPASTEEVAGVVRELARANVTFAPRGAGTGLSGGALAVNRGVIIELARMRRLLKLDVENRLAVVQTGMVNAQVSGAVAAHGLYYAPDPSSGASCTVGGNVAENAGGIHCLKYGVTTDHVVGARVVLSHGEIVDLGSAGAGDCVGYDLLGAFVGSEGTFGIATEATIKLLPLPQAVRTLLADFTDINDASRAVSAIIAEGLIPAALEMVDGATIRAVEASVFAAGMPLDAQAALLIELDGLEAGLDDDVIKVETTCREHGARGVRRAADERERKKLWAARKGAFGAMGRLAPDMMLQDAVVPRSRLPEVLAETYRISAKYDLILANVFHAGDGNLHPILCFDRRDKDELRRVECANREIVETCIRAGGTLTGEHGVGLDKSKYMPLLFSEDTLDAMLSLRAAFDPSGLCNPGKIIPTPRGCGEARAVAAVKNSGGDNGAEPRPPDDEKSRTVALKSEPNIEPSSAEVGSAATPSPVTSKALPSLRADDNLSKLGLRPMTETVRAEFVRIGLSGQYDSHTNTLTVEPTTTEDAAALMKLAAREGVAVVPAGAETWLDTCGSPPRDAVIVSTRRLDRIVEHSPADLVATVGAGLTLASLNAELARAGQWLPLDPPDDGRATVGGVVATGATGAQAFAYGSPRAFVLGMTVVLADGRVIRVGGRVVKNVAGYDLCKLLTGSYGTLGLITEITFKLRPRPAREATLTVRSDRRDLLFAAARHVLAGQFLPTAVEISNAAPASPDRARAETQHTLLVRFAGAAQTVASQLERARAVCTQVDPSLIAELVDDDATLWRAVAAEPLCDAHQLRFQIGVLPTRLPEIVEQVERLFARHAATPLWRADLGGGRLRVFSDSPDAPDACARSLSRLREEVRRRGGSLVVEHASEELCRELSKQGFDDWGINRANAALMRAIKRELDPRGLLSPGRFSREVNLPERARVS